MIIVLMMYYLEEVEVLCDMIVIINNGLVVVCEKKFDFLFWMDEKMLFVWLDIKFCES